MNRVTLEHLENGVVTSSRMLSGETWMKTIVAVGEDAGEHSWMASAAILNYLERETDSCYSMEEMVEIVPDVDVCLACLRVIGSSMASDEVAEFVKRFDLMKTAEYWDDPDEGE